MNEYYSEKFERFKWHRRQQLTIYEQITEKYKYMVLKSCIRENPDYVGRLYVMSDNKWRHIKSKYFDNLEEAKSYGVNFIKKVR